MPPHGLTVVACGILLSCAEVVAHAWQELRYCNILYSTACKAHTIQYSVVVLTQALGWADVTHSPKGTRTAAPVYCYY